MRQRNAFTMFVFLYLCLNAAIIHWIGTQWIRTDFGKVGMIFFVVGCFLLVTTIQTFQWKSPITKSALLASLGFLAVSTGVIPIGYNVIRSVCFALGFIIGISAFAKLPRKTIFLLSSWLLSCLPVMPFLGSTIGLVNREMYTSGLHIFFHEAQRIGTSLYDGEYAFHIDAGCSGVQGMYLLWGCWNLLAQFASKTNVRIQSLFEGLTLFWAFNGIRVATLYFLHNKMYILSLTGTDFILGIGSLVIALGCNRSLPIST